MRKIICLLLILSVSFSLVSCGNSDGVVKETEKTSSETNKESDTTEAQSEMIQTEYENDEIHLVNFDVLYEETDNYKIYTTEDESSFRYFVYSNDGSWLDDGYGGCSGSEGVVNFTEEDKYLVLEHASMGNTVNYKYYDLDNNLVSKYFPSPCKVSGDLIAYFTYKNGDVPCLIVQDIFEPSLYYKMFEWNYSSYLFRDPSSVAFEFMNGNTELKITYLNENTNEYDMVAFDL